jgi:hypothetical protein
MVSSTSQLRSAIECARHESDHLRLVCEVLARGVIRCRQGKAGESAEALRVVATESVGDENNRIATCVEEDGRCP